LQHRSNPSCFLSSETSVHRHPAAAPLTSLPSQTGCTVATGNDRRTGENTRGVWSGAYSSGSRRALGSHCSKSFPSSCWLQLICKARQIQLQLEQVAPLSQRDRAAGCVSFGQKWKTGIGRTIFYGHYRSIFNHCDIIGLQSYRIL